jgi:hypothetical protein
MRNEPARQRLHGMQGGVEHQAGFVAHLKRVAIGG